jgi:P4 family phage/plasmid primase-like protien
MAPDESVLEIAMGYYERGWSPVYVPLMEKHPVQDGWQEQKPTPESIRRDFGNGPCNIGVRLGAASRGLHDVDLDCPEAARLAPRHLPPTLTFGRGHSPRSHYLYYSSVNKIKTFTDPGGKRVLEVRGNGQTIFPGSLYKGDEQGGHRGEPIRWDDDREVLEIGAEELEKRAGRLAASVLLLRRWEQGKRDDLATALAGALLRDGWEPEDVDSFIGAIAEEARDEEYRHRKNKAERLKRSLEEGKGHVPGKKKLKQVLGEEVFSLLEQALGPGRGGPFFHGKTFLPAAFVTRFLEGQDFFHDGSHLYQYSEEGYYREKNDKEISQAMQEILGIDSNSHRISDATNLLCGRVYKDPDKLRQDPQLVNVRNGMLDVRARKLYPHDKSYCSRVQLPIVYDPSAKCPRWDQFGKEVFPEDPMKWLALQDFSGYALHHTIFIQEALFLIGLGGNGKGVFLNALCSIVGRHNYSGLGIHHFSNPFLLGTLRDKLLNVSSESPTSGSVIEIEAFKKCVSGDAAVQADEKHKAPFTFKPIAKHILAMNEVPPIRDRTYAFERRFQVVRFNETFKGGREDRSLNERVAQELPGILNWCLEGLNRVLEARRLTVSEAMQKDKQAFLKELSPLEFYLEENCALGEGLKVERDELFRDYTEWMKESNLKPLGKIHFYEELRRSRPEIKDYTYGKNQFNGIALRDKYAEKSEEELFVEGSQLFGAKGKQTYIQVKNPEQARRLGMTLYRRVAVGDGVQYCLAGDGLRHEEF